MFSIYLVLQSLTILILQKEKKEEKMKQYRKGTDNSLKYRNIFRILDTQFSRNLSCPIQNKIQQKTLPTDIKTYHHNKNNKK